MQGSNLSALIKKYGWLIGLVAVAFVGLGILQFMQQRDFRVSSTTPSLRKMSYISPFLDINFNRALSSEKLDVTASANIMDEFHVRGKTLHITTNRLQPHKTYVITIRHVQDSEGSVITNKKLTFTTTNDTRLSPAQNDELTKLQDRKPAAAVDPLLAHLPHNTLRYRMDALFTTNTANQQVLTVQVQLIIPPDIAGTTQEPAAIEQYKQEVLSYIRSFNLDPAAYTIQYETIKVDLDSTRGGEL